MPSISPSPWAMAAPCRSSRTLLKPSRTPLQAVSPSASPSGSAGEVAPLPRDGRETAQQASAALRRALDAGLRRCRVELLLPLIGATDLDDWPGGVRQQGQAAKPLVAELIRGLGLPAPPPRARVLDDADSIVLWQSPSLSAVVFPTAETLPELKALAKADAAPLLLVNPQWRDGQVVSDFGLGPWRRANEGTRRGAETATVLRENLGNTLT